MRRTIPQDTLAELANSLLLEGQRQSAKGYLHDDEEHFVITSGQRRYRAMLYANENLGGAFEHIRSDIEIKINGKNPSGPDLKFRQLADDNNEKICAEDKAIAIKELIDNDGYTVAMVADRLRCSTQHIRDLLKLLEVPEDIRQAVKKGAISSTAAIKTARARKEIQTEVAERVARGELVKNTDVGFNEGKQSLMTPTEVEAQIKIADKYFNLPKSSNKDRERYRAMIEAFRITQRQADPLR